MPRAKPLPADERRQHILEAVVPLVLERGAAVTTRQAAEAAGLAEGTLFRVFATKNALLLAVLEHVMDPTSMIADLAALDRGAPLVVRIQRTLDLLGSRQRDVRQVLGALHSLTRDTKHHRVPGRDAHLRREAAVLSAVRDVIDDDAAALRIAPQEAAAAILSLSLMMAFPPGLHTTTLTSDRVADILAHGIITEDQSC